jgi:hypothetical protein
LVGGGPAASNLAAAELESDEENGYSVGYSGRRTSIPLAGRQRTVRRSSGAHRRGSGQRGTGGARQRPWRRARAPLREAGERERE